MTVTNPIETLAWFSNYRYTEVLVGAHLKEINLKETSWKDYLVIGFLAITVLFGVGLASYRANAGWEDEKIITFTVKCEDIYNEVVPFIKGRQIVMSDVDGMVIGRIETIKVVDSKRHIKTKNGEILVGIQPLVKDIYITVKGKGRVQEKLIALKNQPIQVGMFFKIFTPSYSLPGKVTAIKVE